MNHDPHQQEAIAKAYANEVRAGKMLLSHVPPERQEAVRKLLEVPDLRQLLARQKAERAQRFREMQANGHTFHRVSSADHAHIFGKLIQDVDAGVKTAVRPLLRDYGAVSGYAPEWADAVANKPQPKRTKASLAKYQDHRVFAELKDHAMLTQTHKAALQQATYAGIAAMLFSGSQSARKLKSLTAEVDAMKRELVEVRAEVIRANVRLDMMDSGTDWKERARAILAVEPEVSTRALARRVGMSEANVRKYKRDLVPCPA